MRKSLNDDIGYKLEKSFPAGSEGKESACNAGALGSIPGQEDPLEKGIPGYFSILAWRISWTEEPSRLYSLWSHEESATPE